MNDLEEFIKAFSDSETHIENLFQDVEWAIVERRGRGTWQEECHTLEAMMDLPSNIVIEDLPGPKRGEWPALYFRDEVIWSPRRTRFALAYSICEVTMCNEVGCLLWGRLDGTLGIIEKNIADLVACCWRSPWCRWLDEEIFVFKAQRFGRDPLVVAHATKGFSIVLGTQRSTVWIDSVKSSRDLAWVPWSEATFVKLIASAE